LEARGGGRRLHSETDGQANITQTNCS
jgi:hypothetical protein